MGPYTVGQLSRLNSSEFSTIYACSRVIPSAKVLTHRCLLLQTITQSEYSSFDSDVLYKIILVWQCMLRVCVCRLGLAIIYLLYFHG